MKNMVLFEVGKPFPVPGAIPHQEGAFMELWRDLVVIIQMPGLRPEELWAFKKGFRKYFPDSRLVELPEASHFFQEDEPDTIVREMNRFLSE